MFQSLRSADCIMPPQSLDLGKMLNYVFLFVILFLHYHNDKAISVLKKGHQHTITNINNTNYRGGQERGGGGGTSATVPTSAPCYSCIAFLHIEQKCTDTLMCLMHMKLKSRWAQCLILYQCFLFILVQLRQHLLPVWWTKKEAFGDDLNVDYHGSCWGF